MRNIIAVNFEQGKMEANAYDKVWQYDYGQTLRIQGLKLPRNVEIHFATQRTGGIALPRVGVTRDGMTDVVIPDSILENGDATSDYPVYAFVYLTNETSGQTEYMIRMQIKSRPRPEVPGGSEDPGAFHEAVQEVRKLTEKATESERQAEGWAHGREDLPERAQDNAKYYAEKASEDAEKTGADRTAVESVVQDVTQMQGDVAKDLEQVQKLTGQAQTSATNAALSEQAAKTSETNAQTAQAGAETAEANAELAEQNAKKSEQAVEQAKQLVTQMGQEVLDNKNHVDQTVHNFDLTAQQALADVNNAGQTQTERVQSAGNTAMESVKTAQNTATKAVETAKTEAIEAIQAEGTAQTGNVTKEGEKQVQAVQQAAQEIVADREQIQMNKEGVAKLKSDIAAETSRATAVENTKADKTALARTDRSLDALWKLNQGISYEFQTDEAEAHQKTVPGGAKMANVKSIGGKTIVWNQLADNSHVNDWGETFIANKHYNKIENHMLYFRHKIKVKSVINEQDTNTKKIVVFATTTKIIGNVNIKKDELKAGYENIVSAIEKMPKDITDISVYNCGNDKVGNTAECEASLFVADLTQMFGSGNEPSTPEEFEAMFPADYYPYNAGELMSAPVNEVVYLDTKNQETSYPIPQAILNLPGYGWSAGNVRNEVNWENKQYIQRVNKADLGTLNWIESGDIQHDGNATYKSNSLNTVIKRYSTYSGNSICEKFNIVQANDINRNEYEYSISNSGTAYPIQFTVKTTFCTDENDFKNKVNGIMLYYELAEPIVTDISDIIGNTFQEPLEVEAGGTLIFKNSHGDDYRIPVSSTEEYLVSLAEVGK